MTDKHSGGRPLKLQSVEDLQEDGEYEFIGIKMHNTEFINEMAYLCRFVV